MAIKRFETAKEQEFVPPKGGELVVWRPWEVKRTSIPLPNLDIRFLYSRKQQGKGCPQRRSSLRKAGGRENIL